MKRTIEIGGITFDLKLVTIIVITTLIPMIDAYNHTIIGIRSYDRFIFYFVIPGLITLLLFREPLSAVGLRIGRWREGLLWVVAVCLVMAVALLFIARLPSMQSYYAVRSPLDVPTIILRTAFELFGWEFVWRGFLLFGLARYFGPGPAIFLQAVPFAFMHLGKPEIEALSTIFGGAGFGFVAWRTQSMLYTWLIHWFIAAFTMAIAIGAL